MFKDFGPGPGHLMERYIMKSIVVHRGNLPTELSSTGVYTLICLMWVSLPFWWLASTAICIMNVRVGFLWLSVKGTWIQPLGSTSSSCCQEKKSQISFSPDERNSLQWTHSEADWAVHGLRGAPGFSGRPRCKLCKHLTAVLCTCH